MSPAHECRRRHGCYACFAPHALALFHLAFAVSRRVYARVFYGVEHGCPEGRSSKTWVDFGLSDHQIALAVMPRDTTAAWQRPSGFPFLMRP
ncbi:hypothetical protein [Paraburkholderia hayleyella]|uniref:hypothetical protein n=1 Tax=Paraburkholderia hayleyella TaxID=2152889 RepID=UPI001290BE8A